MNTNTIIQSLMTLSKAQETISRNVRKRRLQMNLTQQGLAERSGVPLATLRRFEQQGSISLESLLKLLMVLGLLGSLVAATEGEQAPYASIDEVIAGTKVTERQRGRKR